MVEDLLLIRAEDGKIVESKTMKGELKDVVREVASRLLREWDPEISDYVIVRDKYEVSLKLPLSKDQFKKYSRFNLKRTPDGYAVFEIPVYFISYENEWVDEDYFDKKVYVISLYVDDKVKEEIESLASESTRVTRRGRVEFELSEEELEELEEVES